jgi:hypothetical protein
MSNVKNVQAFGKLIGICTGYGGKYNPGQQNLQVNAMITLLNSAQQAMEEVSEAKTTYDNATNNRELAFKQLRKLGTSVISVLRSCGANKLTLKDATVRIRKLNGASPTYRLTLPVENPSKVMKPRPRVARGGDFGSMVDYFSQLVETVSAEVRYKPNEPELSTGGLTATLAKLRSLNEGVMQAQVKLGNARRQRDLLLYLSDNNLFDTANAARQYVKAVCGYRSPQHLEVVRLSFNKPDM